MATSTDLIAELAHESTLTRKMLESVPMEQREWKPHEKSMTIGRLATHIADTFRWVSRIATKDDFDFATANFKMHTAETKQELLSLFNAAFDEAVADLLKMSDDDYLKSWAVKRGEQVMASTPKMIAIRGWAISHLIHHRGQLSVYLRMLNVPVPGMYGPSADER